MLQKTKLLFPLILVFYEIAIYLSNDMYLPALPEMMRDLGLTSQQAQLTLTMWFLGSASLPILVGPITDQYGRRSVLLIGGVIYILATMVCALTANNTVLLTGRFIEGSMMATMLVPGYACIHELFEQKAAIRILALMGSISVLAPACGPLLGGIMLLFASWRGIFWFIAVWACIAILLLNKWMPETGTEKIEKISYKNLFGQYWRVLTNKQFMLHMFVLGFMFGGWIVWISAGPLLVINTFHFSEMAFGVIQAGIFAAYIFGNYLVKYFMERVSVNQLIHIGLGLTLVGGLLVLVMAIAFPNQFYPFLSALIIYSFGSALCFAPLNRVIIDTSEEPMGARVALFTVFLTAFAVLGSAAAGEFFNGTLMSLGILIAASMIISCIMKVFSSMLTVSPVVKSKVT